MEQEINIYRCNNNLYNFTQGFEVTCVYTLNKIIPFFRFYLNRNILLREFLFANLICITKTLTH